MAPASEITLSSLSYMKPEQLFTELEQQFETSPGSKPRVAVIDVRDSDHLGGHIRGSEWVPSDQLDARIPELIRLHGDKEKVVFHCMLSQQRGPRAALKFARALEREKAKTLANSKGKSVSNDGETRMQSEGEQLVQPTISEGKGATKDGEVSDKTADEEHLPKVCVLEGGFGMWQARYGEDERLTEAYVKDLWEDAY
ncbi:Arsenate 2.1 [Cyphellophora attinorum]|uniref:Arsenate 2.1 n=1 Tax=Cyphellophora attinorum TaxID=1664694 RepID=A0A0N1HF51_9EURO|nr:Arsenate 2.1 [Phialophora attinorum]KPI43837.1 Arsenate 2.1 [Phialophora attinorum]